MNESRVSPIPDAVRPYIGYRGWRLAEGAALRSIVRGIIWPRQGLAARCLEPEPNELHLHSGYLRHRRLLWFLAVENTKPAKNHGPVPEAGCSCGIYAGWSAQDARGRRPMDTSDTAPVVWGPVAAWGRVIRGTVGLRAQFMRPLALFSPQDPVLFNLAEETARAYEIPLVQEDGWRLDWQEVGR